jgi:hypothetical protein
LVIPPNGNFQAGDRAFAGFSAISGADWFALYAWSYALLQPEIVQWTPWYDEIGFRYNVYWATSSAVVAHIRQRNARAEVGQSLIWGPEPDVTLAASAIVGQFYSWDNGYNRGSLSVPCAPATIAISAASSSRRFIQPGSAREGDNGNGFNVWTRGYRETVKPEFGTLGDGDPDSNEYSYYAPLSAGAAECHNDWPDSADAFVAVNFIDSQPNTEHQIINGIYLNGKWVGADGGVVNAGSQNTQVVNDQIVQMAIYTRDTLVDGTDGDDAIIGVKFWYADGTSDSFGVTSGVEVASNTLTGGGTYGLQFLSHIEAQLVGNEISYLRAAFRVPAGPALIAQHYVQDTDIDNPTAANFGPDWDADLVRIIWYNPTPSQKVYARITGKFLKSDDSFYTVTDDVRLAAVDGHGIFYYLVAGNNYDIELWSWYNASWNGDVVVSYESDSFRSDVPNGVQVECAQDGSYFAELIEYEALPQPAIDFRTTAEQVFGSNAIATRFSAENAQNVFSRESFFSYIYNDDTSSGLYQDDSNRPSYPRAVREFAGYPSKIELYWRSANSDLSFAADTCIRGLAIIYKDYQNSDVRVYLAGSKADDDGAFSDQGSVIDVGNRLIKEVRGTFSGNDGTDGCLQRILFEYDTAVASDSGCQGPGTGTCTSVLAQQPDNGNVDSEFGLYNLILGVNSDGFYIHSLSANYAQVDIPVLVSRARTTACSLTPIVNYNWIRNSYFYFEYDIATDDGVCGTTQQILNIGDGETQDAPQHFFDHEVVYSQRVTRLRDNPATKTWNVANENSWGITRLDGYEVYGFCYYDAEGIVKSRFATKEENPYEISGVNEFEFKIRFYTDANFDTSIDHRTPTMVIDEPVYVQVGFATALDNFDLITTDCWATKTDDPSKGTGAWEIEQDTCPKDATFVRYSGTSSDVDEFKFDAFAWYDGESVEVGLIYLHCEVRVCPSELTSTYCDVLNPATECGDVVQVTPPFVAGERQRRDLGEVRGVHTQIISASDPIIVVSKRQAEMLQIQRDPVMRSHAAVSGFAGMFSMFVTAMVFVVLVAGYKTYKTRRALLIKRIQEGNC